MQFDKDKDKRFSKQAQMHSNSSADQTVVIDPIHHMSTDILTAWGCTSRESNPGLYRGRVLFYH